MKRFAIPYAMAMLLTLSGTTEGAVFPVADVAGFRQALVDAASNAEDDVIRVAAGTYDVAGSGGTLLYLPGAAGFGNDPHALTIEGAGAGATVLDGGNVVRVLEIGTGSLPDDSAAHVTMSGLTIRNARRDVYNDTGGGARISTGSARVTVAGVAFEGNSQVAGQSFGGGASVQTGGGDILLSGNTFDNNSSYYGGGGAYVRTVTGGISLSNNVFSGNVSQAWVGGGAYVVSDGITGSVTLAGNAFLSNRGVQWGGALYAFATGNATLAGNLFDGNSANMGGAVYMGARSLTFANNLLARNVARSVGGDGGGVHLVSSGVDQILTFTNNTFSGNVSEGRGGGAFLRVLGGAVANVYNSVLWGNEAREGANDGDDLFVDKDAASPLNLYHNDLGANADFATGQSEDLVVANAANYFQGFNLVSDPLLTADLHLAPGSPAANAGDNNAPGLQPTDFDGNPRILYGTVDIGADELSANVVFVDGNAPGPFHNGRSWATAFRTVGEGVSASAAGGEVWVARGTYVENVVMKDGVALYGGFASGMAAREQRDWNANPTVLDGNASGSVVTIQSCPSPETRVDGFTIRNGTGGGGGFPPGAGGGVRISFSNPVIANNVIARNRSLGGYGGGILVDESSPVIAGNAISSNEAYYSGGGIFVYRRSNPEITGNRIDNNAALQGAGIQVALLSNGVLANNRIEGNRAANGIGGGLLVYSRSHPMVVNNVFAGNIANSGGGILVMELSNPLIANNTFAGNLLDSNGSGGGIHSAYTSSPTIANNIVAYGTDGIHAADAASLPVLRNNDVFGNQRGNYVGFATPGPGDISADPGFVDAAGGDYHISPASPCVDAGDTSVVQPGWADMDGEPRVVRGAVDIGADEVPVVVHFVDGNAPGTVRDGTTWATAFRTVQEGLNAAAAGEEVWVARGTYPEHIALPRDVALYGGFAGTEAARHQRDWRRNPAVLDGGSTGIVVSQSSGGPATRIDGFTIRNGHTESIGGGIYALSSHMTIANNLVTMNHGVFAGGGIALYGGQATVENNRIVENTGGGGAGIAIISGGGRVLNNRIEGNEGNNQGGGILFWEGSGTITGNVFAGNSSRDRGRGHGIAMIGVNDSPSIVNNTFDGTGSSSIGSAIYGNTTGAIANNIIVFFRSAIVGGAGTLGPNAVWNGPGTGADPLFNNRLAGDYHLREGSPLINAGDNALVPPDWVDFDYEPRVYGGYGTPTVDIGADEFSYPATAPELAGTPGNGGWYVSDVQVGFTAVDAPGGPGIARTDFSLDGGATWIPFSSPFVIGGEGRNPLFYRSVTNGGVEETVKEATVRIDRTPPTTTASVTGTLGNEGWYRSTAIVTLTAVDTLSGVAETRYSDARDPSVPGDPIYFYDLPIYFTVDGIWTANFRSIDKAGLQEAVRNTTVKVDVTAPVSAVSLSGTAGQGGWYVSDVTATLAASDGTSGVARLEYSMDGGGTWNPYSTPISITAEGTAAFGYRAADVAGNVEAARSEPVKIDKTPPVTTHALAGTAGENGWYVSAVQLSLSATDAFSGVAATRYGLDGAAFVPYAGPVTVSSQGDHAFRFASEDAAGNGEAVQSVSFRIDTVAPAVASTDPQIGATGVLIGKTITVTFPEPVVPGSAFAQIALQRGRTIVPATPSVSGNVLTIDPVSALPRNSVITVTLPAGAVKDAAGNALGFPYVFSFRTGNR